MVLEKRGKKWKRWESPKAQDATSLTPPVFSKDGQTVLTICNYRGEWKAMRYTAGERKPSFEGSFLSIPQQLTLRPSGEGWAATSKRYGTSNGGRFQQEGSDLLVDGERLANPFTSMASPRFAPVGKSIAYKVHDGSKFGIGVDGASTTPKYEFVFAPQFSPDASRIAYVAAAGCTPNLDFGIAWHAEDSLREQGGERFVIIEDLEQRNPQQGSSWLEIRDLTFSPDGAQLAYAARSAEGWQIVVDEEAGPIHDEVGSPRFTSEKNSAVYGSRDGNELWWRVWKKH